VLADVPPATAEVYAINDSTIADQTERLFLTWFVETGDMDDQRTSFFSGSTSFDDLVKNVWTPAKTKDYSPSTARIYVVAHDSRGGVGWRGGVVNLEAAP
jgi:hypothetical protein